MDGILTRRGSQGRCRTQDGYIYGRDLPVATTCLTSVRTVRANWPRIAEDWLISADPAASVRVMVPDGLAVGDVVEWDDRTGRDDALYTIVIAVTSRSVTFRSVGRGVDGALDAAVEANTRYRA